MYLRIDKETEKILAAVREGYGGMFEDGALADRRVHSYLKPVPADPSLGIPEPRLTIGIDMSSRKPIRPWTDDKKREQ